MGKIWILDPTKSIGDLHFGMSREEVHNMLGKDYKQFRKTPISKSLTDEYADCHIYYTEEGKMEAVEIFSEIEVMINGKKLFPNSVKQAKNIIPDLVLDFGSYISRQYSVGLYAPEEDGNIESLLVARESYYS